MASRAQLECIIGESGAGKTLYVVAIRLVDFLKHESGDFWHNLPVKPEGLAALCGKPVEEIESRLKLIPEAELKTWIEGKGGPWSFFAGKEIKGAHIAIDEAHRYFGKRHSKEHLSKLGEWTGGLRHYGATCSLITQHEFKLSTDARNEAGVQTRIFAPSQRKELFSGAKWHDVLQLLSKFWRRKIGLTIVREGVPQGRSARDFMSDGFKYIFHRPAYYAAYDSYNNIAAEGAVGGSDNRPKEEWERFGWWRLLAWYFERNFVATSIRVAALAVAFWLIPLGGIGYCVDSVFGITTTMASSLAGGKPSLSDKTKSVQEPQPTLAKVNPAELSQKMADLAETNRELATRLMEASRYAEELTGLVAVVGDSCYWIDGSSGKVGDNVLQGPFAGRTIVAVDPKRGAVELSGGNVLRVGVLAPAQYERVRSWQAAASGWSQPATKGSAVPGEASAVGRVSGGSSSAVSERRPAGGVAPDNGTVQSDSDAVVHEPARRSIRMLRGGGTSVGPADGDRGFSGYADPGRPGNGGTSPGRGAGGIEGPVLPGPASTRGQGGIGAEVPADD